MNRKYLPAIVIFGGGIICSHVFADKVKSQKSIVDSSSPADDYGAMP